TSPARLTPARAFAAALTAGAAGASGTAKAPGSGTAPAAGAAGDTGRVPVRFTWAPAAMIALLGALAVVVAAVVVS
ncbi:hypothetical protein ACWDR9_28620, partial [Streptosporangium sandarakinum]